jgi:hypothetical protein
MWDLLAELHIMMPIMSLVTLTLIHCITERGTVEGALRWGLANNKRIARYLYPHAPTSVMCVYYVRNKDFAPW